jgi:hypothetical protein
LVRAFGYVRDAIGKNLATFQEFGGYIAKYLAPVIGTVLGGALQVAGKIAGGVIEVIAGVIRVLNGLISGAIAGINALISAYNFANNIFGGKDIAKVGVPSVKVPSISTSVPSGSTASIPKIPTITAPSGGTSGGGVATASRVAASAAVAATGVGSSFDVGRFRMAENASMGTTINLTVTGAFDKEGTARTIINTLNDSFYRGTGGAGQLQAI